MWLFIKHLIQLLLSPSRGWDDVSESVLNADEVQRKGFYPLVGVTALSEFFPLVYSHSEGFTHSLVAAMGIACSLFASMYLSKLFLDFFMPKLIDGTLNQNKVSVFVSCMLGLNCIYYTIRNLMPTSMTLLTLMPLLSVIVIFKSTAYMGIKEDNQLNFTGLAIVAVIGIPILISSLILCFM